MDLSPRTPYVWFVQVPGDEATCTAQNFEDYFLSKAAYILKSIQALQKPKHLFTMTTESDIQIT